MKTIAVSGVRVNRSHRRDLGNVQALAKSIREVGLLHPIVVTPDMTLVAGHRRLEAFKLLGRKTIPANIATNLQDLHMLLKAQVQENTCRKAFTPSEAFIVGQAIERAFHDSVSRNRGGDRRSQEAKSKRVNSPVRSDEPTRLHSIAASAVGMDRRTYEKLCYVVKSKNADAIATMDRTGRIHGAYRVAKVRMQAAAIEREPVPFPKGPFRTLVVDPPWSYGNRPDDVFREGVPPYPCMTIDEIKALPVPALAHKDAVLWLWVTNGHLPLAFDIVASWGFSYRSILTWAKPTFGLGDWLRGQTEHCLLCSKGKATIVLRNQTTLLEAPRGRHSEKPEAFYSLVESMCPGSKVELFQRRARPGWAGYGDEVEAA